MGQIMFLVVLAGSIYLMTKSKKQIPDGQISQDPLVGNDKLIIWILCFLNPVVAGAVFYYGWGTKLPVKAKQTNRMSLWAFLVWIIVFILAIFSGLISV